MGQGPEFRLGALAVRRGFASEPEIETALDLQKNCEPSADRPTAPVGQILVEMGALTEEMLAVLLEEQAKLRESGAPSPETRVDAAGRLVVESSRPVTVNGRPVFSPRALEPGDVVRVGDAVLRYEGPPVLLVPTAAAPGSMLGKFTGAARRSLESVRAVTTKILPRKETTEAIGTTLKGAASKTGETVRRLVKAVTKKRYKSKTEAIRRRDELLAEVGRAEFRAGVVGPDAEAARRAQRTLDETEHHSSTRGSATSQAEASAIRTAIKAAREQLDLALVRLGWQALREGRSPAGLDAAVLEIRAIDEAFAEER